MSKATMVEAMKVLADAVNNYGLCEEDRNELVQEFGNTHRTLQQEVVRSFILPILKSLNELYEKGWYDLRNEGSCRLAHKMLHNDQVDDTYLPFI